MPLGRRRTADGQRARLKWYGGWAIRKAHAVPRMDDSQGSCNGCLIRVVATRLKVPFYASKRQLQFILPVTMDWGVILPLTG